MSQFPTAPAAELSLVAACIVGGTEPAMKAIELVPMAHLFRDDTRDAMGIVEQLLNGGQDVNTITFDGAWRKTFGARPVPVEITAACDQCGITEPKVFADEINSAARRRQILAAAQRAAQRAVDPTADPEGIVAELEGDLGERADNHAEILGPKAATRALVDDVERRFDLQGRRTGICTGFKDLDERTDGLQASELAVIAARPSVGKTAIVANIVERACLVDQIPTALFTYEMSPSAIMRRIFCGMFRVPLTEIKTGKLTEATFEKFKQFQVCMRDAPLFIINALSGVNVTRLCAIARRLVRQHKVKLVCVDYLQRIPPAEKHEKRTYEVGNTSSQLKALAVNSNIAVLVAAQLSREPEKDKGRYPRLSDLADSAQIERDADLVAMLHRERNDDGDRHMLIVGKQRDGEVGIVNLRFAAQFVKFENA